MQHSSLPRPLASSLCIYNPLTCGFVQMNSYTFANNVPTTLLIYYSMIAMVRDLQQSNLLTASQAVMISIQKAAQF